MSEESVRRYSAEIAKLRDCYKEQPIREFVEMERPLREKRGFLMNLVDVEYMFVNFAVEDYILQKRLGVGKVMKSIQDGLSRSVAGRHTMGDFFIDEKTTSECMELVKQQGDDLLQSSLDYIDRYESYAAMFDALPNFRPRAA